MMSARVTSTGMKPCNAGQFEHHARSVEWTTRGWFEVLVSALRVACCRLCHQSRCFSLYKCLVFLVESSGTCEYGCALGLCVYMEYRDVDV